MTLSPLLSNMCQIHKSEPFSILPREVTIYIFSFLDVDDLKKIASVSRLFHCLSSDNQIWKTKAEHRFSFLMIQITKKFNENWKQTYRALATNASEIFRLTHQIIAENLCFPTGNYVCLINACTRPNNTAKDFERFNQMITLKLCPPIVAYTRLINTCVKNNDISKAFHIFSYMIATKIHPTLTTYRRLSNACIKANDIEKAEVLDRMWSSACFCQNQSSS